MSVITRKTVKGASIYWVSFRWNGKKVWERAGRDKREATRLNALRLKDVRDKAYIPPKERRPTTFGQWIESWVDRRRNRSAVSDERNIRNYILPIAWLHELPLADIRPKHMERMVRDLQVVRGKKVDRLGAGITRNIYRLVQTSLKEARRLELIAVDPCVLPKDLLSYQAKEKTIYGREEIVSLCTDERITHAQRVFATLLFFTGMRKGEASGRTWADWDEKPRPLGSLLVHSQYDGKPLKTEKTDGPRHPRGVPVHPLLAAVLADWRDRGFELAYCRKPLPTDPIVPAAGRWSTATTELGHVGPRGLIGNWERACLRAGVPYRTVHSTRHTFITMCLRGGAIKPHLEKVTHNAKGDMLDHYTHMDWVPLCHAVACLGVEVGVDSVSAVAIFEPPRASSGRAHTTNVGQLEATGIVGPPSITGGMPPRALGMGAKGDPTHPAALPSLRGELALYDWAASAAPEASR